MTSHYEKLTEVMNEFGKDIMTISDIESRVNLIEEFDHVRKPIYKLIESVQKAKEQQKPETSLILPEVIIKAKMEKQGLIVQQSRDYVNSLTSLSNEYKDMVHDFIHLYACFMLSCFVIVDGKCITKEVKRSNVRFGKFEIKNIIVML